MDTAIVVALLALAGSIIATPVSSYFSKKREIEVEWQRKKIKHYEELLSAMSDLAIEGRDRAAAKIKFSNAVNTITLIAGQSVINALMAFCDEIKFDNQSKSLEKHNDLLKKLMLEIRKDVGLIKNDEDTSFDFRFIQP